MSDPVVVVGAGVAGCVAARTLADEGRSVVLLDAGPGPDRPSVLDRADHLRTAEALDWWYPDLPRRGRGFGGGSAVNGMVLDALHPLDIKRWGWDDAEEHQQWILERWGTSTVEPGPFTAAFGECAGAGFPAVATSAESGAIGWMPLALAMVDGRRVSAHDAFVLGADPALLQSSAATTVERIELAGAGAHVHLVGGEVLDAAHVVVAAGVVGSPALLVASGLIEADAVAEPLNHSSVAIIVELDPALRAPDDAPPSSRLLRTVTGLSENTVDLQMLVLDHTGTDDVGRRHGAVIVSALEPDRQKVLVAGINQALYWLRTIQGVGQVSLSEDQSPVQHQCCTLTEAALPDGPITVLDSSVLPALPHTNPMMSIAVGARRQALALLDRGAPDTPSNRSTGDHG